MASRAAVDAPAWRADTLAGVAAIAPVMVAAVPVGLVFGAVGIQAGLSPVELTLMSALVFAGAAQFVALDLWASPAPWLALTISAFIVNLRHVLMGASLAPHLKTFPRWGRWAGLFLLADEVWALALRRATERGLTPAFYAGLAGGLYAAWVAGTLAGSLLGGLITDPERYGLDFAFIAIFLCLIIGFWRGRRSVLPWIAAGGAAIVAQWLLPGVWYVVIGGLIGATVGAITAYGDRNTTLDVEVARENGGA